FAWRILMPAVAGTESSPMRMPVFDSMNFRFDRSDCGASKSFFASSETYFTLRSWPRRTAGTPEATRRLTTLVMASDADSIGNGTTGALGKGSSATAGAAGEDEDPTRCVAAVATVASGGAVGRA